MRAPAFYYRKAGLSAALLAPFAAIYGAIAAARLRRKGARAAIPVFCVGNPTLGGAGKTPAAIALARMLHSLGERPFLITRGYGGRRRGPTRVDPEHDSAADVGDEALLLARAYPTVVARDRAAGAAFAAASGASAVILDDGFQNPALAKDFSLLAIDAAHGIGNGRVFPAGPLRAPLTAQLAAAQAIMRIGDGDAAASVVRKAAAMEIPVFSARLVPDKESASALAGKAVLAFAGIGHPEKFFATLAAAGAQVAEARPFPDHHRYSPAEAGDLLEKARARNLVLVTTEKDQARMHGDAALAELARTVRVLPVRLVFNREAEIRAALADALARARG